MEEENVDKINEFKKNIFMDIDPNSEKIEMKFNNLSHEVDEIIGKVKDPIQKITSYNKFKCIFST